MTDTKDGPVSDTKTIGRGKPRWETPALDVFSIGSRTENNATNPPQDITGAPHVS